MVITSLLLIMTALTGKLFTLVLEIDPNGLTLVSLIDSRMKRFPSPQPASR